MNAVDILVNEHGLIRHYLDNLAMAVEKIGDGKNPPRKFFDLAVEFARTYADKYHHVKEEYLMFTRLAEKHNGEIDGQIDKLRQQHERGRTLVNGFADALDGYEAGDGLKTGTLVENIAAYTALLRHHLHTEDHVFFPMARKQLTDQEMGDLLREFESTKEKMGGNTFEECHKMVVDMGSMLVHL